MTAPTLTEFLLARIAEDEAAALQAVGHESRVYWDTAVHAGDIRALSVEHYSRHDPDRVLAECEAKRRIVKDEIDWMLNDSDSGPCWGSANRLLRHLALPYADHPDYDQHQAEELSKARCLSQAGLKRPHGITPGGMTSCPSCGRWGSGGGLCLDAFHEADQ